MGGNICIFDSQHLVNVFALDPFSDEGRGSNGGSATKGFEFGVLNIASFIYFDLELHDIAARRRADKSLRRGRRFVKKGRVN